MADTNQIAATPVQKVVVVNGNTEVLGMLETVLDAGRYDMVFVESSDRAYSQIKKVVPNLVILCTRIEELDGFQLLDDAEAGSGDEGHSDPDVYDRVRGAGFRLRRSRSSPMTRTTFCRRSVRAADELISGDRRQVQVQRSPEPASPTSSSPAATLRPAILPRGWVPNQTSATPSAC